jgi:hypothetical protein
MDVTFPVPNRAVTSEGARAAPAIALRSVTEAVSATVAKRATVVRPAIVARPATEAALEIEAAAPRIAVRAIRAARRMHAPATGPRPGVPIAAARERAVPVSLTAAAAPGETTPSRASAAAHPRSATWIGAVPAISP